MRITFHPWKIPPHAALKDTTPLTVLQNNLMYEGYKTSRFLSKLFENIQEDNFWKKFDNLRQRLTKYENSVIIRKYQLLPRNDLSPFYWVSFGRSVSFELILVY